MNVKFKNNLINTAFYMVVILNIVLFALLAVIIIERNQYALMLIPAAFLALSMLAVYIEFKSIRKRIDTLERLLKYACLRTAPASEPLQKSLPEKQPLRSKAKWTRPAKRNSPVPSGAASR